MVTDGSPEVAVVIPAHDPGTFLIESVESALAQTAANIEVVVVDDGSDEGRFPELPTDDRLTVVHQSNQGVSAARNRGARNSSAPLIAFLDADDRWTRRSSNDSWLLWRRVPRLSFASPGLLT